MKMPMLQSTCFSEWEMKNVTDIRKIELVPVGKTMRPPVVVVEEVVGCGGFGICYTMIFNEIH